MPDHTNLEDYTDPDLFDLENQDFEPDGPFYLALAKKLGGAALELGCGTGRVTIPLARQGIEITGLDIVPGMLATLEAKPVTCLSSGWRGMYVIFIWVKRLT